MTEEEKEALYKSLIEEMRQEIKNDDTEAAHCNADYILCRWLEALNFHELLEAYEEVDKWYA